MLQNLQFGVLLDKIESSPGLQNSFLIMHNARIHKTLEIRNMVDNTLKFLPPYSPITLVFLDEHIRTRSIGQWIA